jgi:hypothetical protein
VLVPHAGRFAMHKLAVYALRSDAAKRDKDATQAALLVATIAEHQDFLLDDAIAAMDRTLRSKAKPGARRALELLGSHHAAASHCLEKLVA